MRRAGQSVAVKRRERVQDRTLVVVAYDVRDDRRRTRLATVLLGFGARIQGSVYELWIDGQRLERMWAMVGQEVAAEDYVRCYIICGGCEGRTRSYGMADPTDVEVFIV
jgi:CRISPR-associated protein Cas2